jgi:hypothetical protein
MTAGLDDWLPSAAVRTRHRRAARASADDLWRAASTIRLADTRRLGRLVRWRIPGLSAALTYHELFRTYPFCVLAESDHRLISGLCGRIWTLSRDYAQLSGPDDFLAWREPRTVRVLFAHWVTPGADGRSTLYSEARVAPTDSIATMRLRALWLALGPFERLIGAEALALAAEQAQQGAASSG